MLAIDDILKTGIYLLDEGLKVSLNPTRQLNILSLVSPQVTSSSESKHSMILKKTCLQIQLVDKAHKAVAGVSLYRRN